MKGLLADYLVKSTYGIDPDIMHKLYQCTKLIKNNNINDDPINQLLQCVNNILKLQIGIPNTKYHKNNRLLLIIDEIYIRLSNAILFGENNQVQLFLQGELSLYNLGKTSSEVNIINFDSCISCGDKLQFSSSTKKYTCDTCYCEYQS